MGIPKTELPQEGLSIETLMEALFYRDEFLSIASHELRTPLTSLKLQAQVFKRNSKRKDSNVYSKEKIDQLVEQVDRQTSYMVQLVDAMLDVSRIRSGQFRMVKSEVNITELLGQVLTKIDSKQISFVSKKEIVVEADEARLEQVFINLARNALRYGMGRPVEVRLSEGKTSYRISFKDQGMGISEADQKRIFQRFQRAVPAKEVSGLGLGLYISKEIIEAHGGQIKVKSKLDQGSTFIVELPKESK